MLRLQDYAIFNHLQQSGVPLRASARFGEGLAAALWEREGRGHYHYNPANHHTLSFWVAEGAGFRRLRGRGYDPIHGESSLWVVPAGASTAWEAAGKGRLLHFYIPTPVFESRVVETLDADPSLISLREEGLQRDPSLENIIRSMVLPLSWEEPADRIAITQAGEMLNRLPRGPLQRTPAESALHPRGSGASRSAAGAGVCRSPSGAGPDD
ncbi:hypothetical protein [Rhizobium leguminosarum]|uniref:hypothetical protein n=1 Tax=Rhizobium leguminosarum TaxID=384 RepID=UPI001FEED18C|nr:hypothetical protein [Rhizobium leguminosarum]